MSDNIRIRGSLSALPSRHLGEYGNLVPEQQPGRATIMRVRVAEDDPRLFPLKDKATRDFVWKEERKRQARLAEQAGLKKPGCTPRAKPAEYVEVLGDITRAKETHLAPKYDRWDKSRRYAIPRNLGPASNKSWTTGRKLK